MKECCAHLAAAALCPPSDVRIKGRLLALGATCCLLLGGRDNVCLRSGCGTSSWLVGTQPSSAFAPAHRLSHSGALANARKGQGLQPSGPCVAGREGPCGAGEPCGSRRPGLGSGMYAWLSTPQPAGEATRVKKHKGAYRYSSIFLVILWCLCRLAVFIQLDGRERRGWTYIERKHALLQCR
jgi:hypothetical protein